MTLCHELHRLRAHTNIFDPAAVPAGALPGRRRSHYRIDGCHAVHCQGSAQHEAIGRLNFKSVAASGGTDVLTHRAVSVREEEDNIALQVEVA